MKIKRLSILLALVMILSAFAGTFTISAEGEAVAQPWKVGETTYATLEEAYAAAEEGGTIYLTADATLNTPPCLENKKVTIEGVQKDGVNPVIYQKKGIHCKNSEVVIKNIDLEFDGSETWYSHLYAEGTAKVTLINSYIHTVYNNGTNSDAIIRLRAEAIMNLENCKIEIDQGSLTADYVVCFDSGEKGQLHLTNCEITTPHPEVYGDSLPSTATITYNGTTIVNGVVYIDGQKCDEAALKQGYAFRVGDAETAYAKGIMTLYFADFAEAAAKAIETKQALYLLKDYTMAAGYALTGNLTVTSGDLGTCKLTVPAGKEFTATAADATLAFVGVNVVAEDKLATLAATNTLVVENTGVKLNGDLAATGAKVETKGITSVNGTVKDNGGIDNVAVLAYDNMILVSSYLSTLATQEIAKTISGATLYVKGTMNLRTSIFTRDITVTSLGARATIVADNGSGCWNVDGHTVVKNIDVLEIYCWQAGVFVVGDKVDGVNAHLEFDGVNCTLTGGHYFYNDNAHYGLVRLRADGKNGKGDVPMYVTVKNSFIKVTETYKVCKKARDAAAGGVFVIAKDTSAAEIKIINSTIDLSASKQAFNVVGYQTVLANPSAFKAEYENVAIYLAEGSDLYAKVSGATPAYTVQNVPFAYKTTNGNVDTYKVVLPSGETFFFSVSNGVDGAPGANGTNGVDGVDGAPGAAGVNGTDGAKGDKGDKGDTGATGPAGVAGATGATGADGAPAPTGIYVTALIIAIIAILGDVALAAALLKKK